jgi:hypothetical protein
MEEKMRTLDEVIKLIEVCIEVDEEVISECDLNNYHEKDTAQSYGRYVEWNRQIAGWLKQLQEIQGIIEEYRSVPVEVMNSDDALTKICKIIDE